MSSGQLPSVLLIAATAVYDCTRNDVYNSSCISPVTFLSSRSTFKIVQMSTREQRIHKTPGEDECCSTDSRAIIPEILQGVAASGIRGVLQLRQGDLHVSIEVKSMGVFQSYFMAAMLLSRLNGYLHNSK
jgi:hypothetical protein